MGTGLSETWCCVCSLPRVGAGGRGRHSHCWRAQAVGVAVRSCQPPRRLHISCCRRSAFPVAAAGRPSMEARWYPEILVLSASWSCGYRRGQPQVGGGSAAPALLCPQADICGRHAGKDHPVS